MSATLNNADEKIVALVVNAFREWLAAQERGESVRSNPRVTYGRELLGFPKDSLEAAVWVGFDGGFGAGCAYMSDGKKEVTS